MRFATLKNWKAALFLAVIAASVSPALALVSQDDVFRSLTQNMDSEPDYGKLLPWLFAIAGLIAVIIYIRQRQKRQAVPKALNHPGKLVREVVRLADLDPDELKALK